MDWRAIIDLFRLHSRAPSNREQTTARWSFSLALLLTVAVGLLLTFGLLDFHRRARHGQEQEALAQQNARTQKLASELGTTLRGAEQLVNTPQVRNMVGEANLSPSETLYVTSPAGALLAHPREQQLLAWGRARGRPVRCLCELTLEDLRAWEHEQGLDRGRHHTEANVPQAGWRVFASTDESVLFKSASQQRRLVVALCVMLWAGLGASGMAMIRSERTRALQRTLAERQRREEERQRLLAQVRQRSAELQAILEGMVDAVLVTDAMGVITLANRAALMLFGQMAHEGTRLDSVYPHHHPRGLDGQDIPFKVVRTLLDASQLQLGQLRFEKEVVELSALVEAATARTAANHPRNPIHLQPFPETRVFGDRTRLEQVLAELLDNAARYSPVDQGVDVALTLDGDEVEISIQDKGIGIPAEQQDRVFERFYRAHAGTPHDRGGLGLGLFLARGIVLQHGGRLELESREGEGTRVRLHLPRLPEQQPAPGRNSCETPTRPPVEQEFVRDCR